MLPLTGLLSIKVSNMITRWALKNALYLNHQTSKKGIKPVSMSISFLLLYIRSYLNNIEMTLLRNFFKDVFSIILAMWVAFVGL